MTGRLTPNERARAAWELMCPRCEAEPGHPCDRPRGGRGHHRERRTAVTTKYAPEEIRRLLAKPVRRSDGYRPEPVVAPEPRQTSAAKTSAAKKPKRWTKKDISFLKNKLLFFVLFHEMYWPRDRIRAVIEEHRHTIVLGGVRSFRGLLADRSKSYRESVEHFRTHPSVYGNSTPEIIERFTRLADECDADVAKLDQMIERVEAEGLPPEVLEHMPERVDRGGTPDHERLYQRRRW